MLFWLSLLYSIASTTATAVPEHSQLVQVQIILRHASLEPMLEFSTDGAAKLFPQGYGEANVSLFRESKEGAAFKQHYTQLGLLNAVTVDEEVLDGRKQITENSPTNTEICPLISVVSKSIDDAIRSNSSERLERPVRIFYTHKDFIIAMAQVLGFKSEYGKSTPRFSSAIVIELWKSSRGYDIQIVIKDGVHNPFKIVANYRLPELENLFLPCTTLTETDIDWSENETQVINIEGAALEKSNDSSVAKMQIINEELALNCKLLLVFFIVVVIIRALVCRRPTFAIIYPCSSNRHDLEPVYHTIA